MNKNLTTKQNANLVLNKLKSTLSITSKILSDKTSLTTESVEEWIKELWDWADENDISDLQDQKYSSYDVVKNMEAIIHDKFKVEHNIDVNKDLMARSRIYYAVSSNIKNIRNITSFDISLPFLAAKDNNGPIHFYISFTKSEITEIIKHNSINKNIINGIPRDKDRLIFLSELTLESQELESIPIGFFKLVNLIKLNLKGNSLCRAGGNNSFNFLKGINKLQKLQTLQIANSSLSVLSEDIGSLKDLKHLILNNNQFMKKLPDAIVKLRKLEEFNIKNCDYLELTDEQKEWIKKLKENGCIIKTD